MKDRIRKIWFYAWRSVIVFAIFFITGYCWMTDKGISRLEEIETKGIAWELGIRERDRAMADMAFYIVVEATRKIVR